MLNSDSGRFDANLGELLVLVLSLLGGLNQGTIESTTAPLNAHVWHMSHITVLR